MAMSLGGSIRNHKADDLKKVLEILGHSEEKIEKILDIC